MEPQRSDRPARAGFWAPAIVGLLLLTGGCSGAPTAARTSSHAERPGWQIMDHIKLAAFSATDPGEYDLMIFCDSDNHVRLYHLVPPEEHSTELSLRSGSVSIVLAGERELVTITPPPAATEQGEVLGARISARLARTTPVWRAFAETGALEVRSGPHVTNADARGSEHAALTSLFAACLS